MGAAGSQQVATLRVLHSLGRQNKPHSSGEPLRAVLATKIQCFVPGSSVSQGEGIWKGMGR